jgi:hypothetical protein
MEIDEREQRLIDQEFELYKLDHPNESKESFIKNVYSKEVAMPSEEPSTPSETPVAELPEGLEVGVPSNEELNIKPVSIQEFEERLESQKEKKEKKEQKEQKEQKELKKELLMTEKSRREIELEEENKLLKLKLKWGPRVLDRDIEELEELSNKLSMVDRDISSISAEMKGMPADIDLFVEKTKQAASKLNEKQSLLVKMKGILIPNMSMNARTQEQMEPPRAAAISRKIGNPISSVPIKTSPVPAPSSSSSGNTPVRHQKTADPLPASSSKTPFTEKASLALVRVVDLSSGIIKTTHDILRYTGESTGMAYPSDHEYVKRLDHYFSILFAQNIANARGATELEVLKGTALACADFIERIMPNRFDQEKKKHVRNLLSGETGGVEQHVSGFFDKVKNWFSSDSESLVYYLMELGRKAVKNSVSTTDDALEMAVHSVFEKNIRILEKDVKKYPSIHSEWYYFTACVVMALYLRSFMKSTRQDLHYHQQYIHDVLADKGLISARKEVAKEHVETPIHSTKKSHNHPPDHKGWTKKVINQNPEVWFYQSPDSRAIYSQYDHISGQYYYYDPFKKIPTWNFYELAKKP